MPVDHFQGMEKNIFGILNKRLPALEQGRRPSEARG